MRIDTQQSQGLANFVEKIPDEYAEVAFVFHTNEYPFSENKRINVAKEHYEAAMLAIDRREEGTTEAVFSIAVMYSSEEHNKPCKLVKLVHAGYDRPLVESFSPEFDEKEMYRNCFLIH